MSDHRVDLDGARTHYEQAFAHINDAVKLLPSDLFPGPIVAHLTNAQNALINDVPALVAELRVAREVITDARFIAEHDKRALPPDHPINQLRATLAAYDQHTQDPGP
jgi:hypothetical protein